METLIHTAEGELKREGPIMSKSCGGEGLGFHRPDLSHEPVPCMAQGSKGEPCQCVYCISQYSRDIGNKRW